MKQKAALLSILFLAVFSVKAQQKIEVSSILKDIKDGKSIVIENATISGILDFTFMDKALEKLPNRKLSFWGNSNGDNTIEKNIDVQISFTNCVFEDDVLAYIPNDSGYTFTASFEESVTFKTCTFERKAMFKYSRFEENTDFSKSIFEDDNTFKYAKFKRNSDFSKVLFKETATFKYAKFSRKADFSKTTFKDTATFKYTKFNDGVSFKKANFEEDLNIKYVKVTGDFDISDMKVSYDIDAKYAKINGKKFNKSLVSN